MNNWIEIDGHALRSNYDVFSSLLGPKRMAPVLKSNAYGHGLSETYRVIQDKSPQCVCVNYTFEAETLRKLGYRGRLLIVGPTFKDDLEHAYEVDADCVLVSQEQMREWLTLKRRPRVHIKIDSGMHRQGFLEREWPTVAKCLAESRENVHAVCTHFANVEDVLDQGFALAQLKTIRRAHQFFCASGFTVDVHSAASASTLILPESRLDMGRIGISLYGYWPSSETRLSFLKQNDRIVDLRPALTWKTKVSQIKPLEQGDYVGYGLAFRAPRAMRIAVLPVGYNEGYPRLCGERQSYVLVAGRRAQVIGRICMNMMMIDVSHINDISVSEPVVLLGKDASSDEVISTAQFAEWSNTIHYEALTRLHPHIPRITKDD